MATLSTESARYISQHQKILAGYKVGQYSKFLSKNPIFVTYYAINHARSRTDSGTGNIQEYIGPQSPIRFNKVLTLPVYNVPDLRPEVVNDEGGHDVEMDISDITFLPGTIRPQPGDCMRFDIPGTPPILYQCTTFRHNTIQSNDFYMGDYHLLDIEQKYITEIENQVVERLICNFEKIGTNAKAIITEEEDQNNKDTIEFIDQLSSFYNDAFYSRIVDGFVLTKGNQFNTQWYWDAYLTKFINESAIFSNADSDITVVLPYLDLRPMNFDFVFGRTLWSAVLKGKSDYLNQYTYAWNGTIQSRTSPFLMSSIPAIEPFVVLCDHYVTPQEPVPPELHDVVNTPGQGCGWVGTETLMRPYFSLSLVESIMTNTESEELNIIEKIIYQFMTGGIEHVKYDTKSLIQFAFHQDMFTYMHMPIIIYILRQKIGV